MNVRKNLIRAFGKNVKGRQKSHKWRQLKLATAAGIRTTTISEIERGATNARLSTVESIAQALRVDPVAFMNRLSDSKRTFARQEAVFISGGWEEIGHGSPWHRSREQTCNFTSSAKNLSQLDLATLADVRMGTISEIELAKTNPQVSMTESIALALQINPTFFVRRPARCDALLIGWPVPARGSRPKPQRSRVPTLLPIDRLYPQARSRSALQQLLAQLSNAMPFDLDERAPGCYRALRLRAAFRSSGFSTLGHIHRHN